MNFYNGVENIIKRISKVYYNTIPKGDSWHKELLILSYAPPDGKLPVFNRSIVEKLHQYKNFRHRFISGYGFQLKGEKMLHLVDNVDDLWNDIQIALEEFCKRI